MVVMTCMTPMHLKQNGNNLNFNCCENFEYHITFIVVYKQCIFIVYYLFVPTNAHTHIYQNIKLYYERSYMFQWFYTIFREL